MNQGDVVVISLIAAECKSACANEPDLEQRIFKAMKPVANGFWMDANEDTCFRGAMAAALMAPETTDEDKERVRVSMKAINALSAMMSHVPVDMGAVLDELEAGPKPVLLMDLWRRAKQGEAS